ncbi:OmpA family protein [Saccharicrinis sp. FJH54]|uniref:OmpA family protein n=1 Tax=Saccharicrinis sp. FJH54 TaxID=3344665 RepID=UPI0035D478D4
MKTKFKTKLLSLTSFILIITLISSCSASRTMKGGAIGSGVGGTIGGVIGSQSDNTATGAILGAMIGGTAGALIGKYMDKQAEELKKDLEGADVERVGEGIKITFDSGILFDFDSYKLRDASIQNLNELAETLKKYDDTEVLIEGHTDNVGDDAYNMELSQERANAVSDYLNNLSIPNNRLVTEGYGEEQPVASNDTKQGRQQNRRVEVAIYANNKLKRAAKRGDI